MKFLFFNLKPVASLPVTLRIKQFSISKKGFTLIDVLVGIALLLIVFLGIFGAFELSLKVVGLSKNKIVATAIASGQIEKIRSLSYSSVGTVGVSLPYAEGVLETSTTTMRNNVEYTIEIQVKYVLDDADGSLGSGDSCYLDYKRAEVKVSWTGRFEGEVKLVTDVAPENKVEEINTCTAQPGGVLSVSVFNAYGEMINFPLIKVFNPVTGDFIVAYTPADGKQDIPFTPSTYKVVVSKEGYSTERTYSTSEIATPKKPNPIILENQLIEISFSIDKVSSFSVDTLSPWSSANFSDSFLNETKISEKANVVVDSGKVELATDAEGYLASGYVISAEISPTSLVEWDELIFSDSEPAETDLDYQLYYASGTDWYLIPDSALAGNSSGLEVSPVDLSDLSITSYPRLKIKGNFSTNSTSSTPTLYDWQVSWKISAATPIPNAHFWLQGAKIIGTDAEENSIPKYSTTLISDSNGHRAISDLEWDSYTFSASSTSLDLISTDPSPQPINLPPDTTQSVKLYFQAENSLLINIQDAETLEPIFGASVRLYNTGLGYDETQYTNAKGQTYFIPLQAGTYTAEVSLDGFQTKSENISVSGDKSVIISLQEEI